MESTLIKCVIARMAAILACELSVLPFWFKSIRIEDRVGLGYSFAGG